MKCCTLLLAATLACTVVAVTVHGEESVAPKSFAELLESVRQGQRQEAQDARQREARFLADRDTRRQELDAARARVLERQNRSDELEKRFEANERQLGERQRQLREKLGSLADLLGDLATVASEARDGFGSSLSAAEWGDDRVARAGRLLDKVDDGVDLPKLAELEDFWFELQRELTAGGEVHAFEAEVVDADGVRSPRTVVRVGVFNIVSAAGDYLQFDPRSGLLAQLPRQPARGARHDAAELARASGGMHAFALDPTGPSGGSLLAALTASPSFAERVRQGGAIGYLIMALGLLAAGLALQRFVVLLNIERRIEAQRVAARLSMDNPLGRVLAVHEANPSLDTEALELKLSEAVLRELPSIERGLSLLRLIAMVAPLLGLLGTVTGMITTFQSITIFGAGDPKAMAGGISQALVTTVQGLCVAIPLAFVHALLGSQVRRITQILEEETTGIIGERAAASLTDSAGGGA